MDSSGRRSDGYCSANCVDSWLSDKFCDQVCNNAECGFDLGDCGTDNFNLIYGLDFHPNRRIYYYPSDSKAIYFNFNKYFDANHRYRIEEEFSEITYQNNSFVRSAAMNEKHMTLVFLFYADQPRHELNVTLKALRNSSEVIMEFQALVSEDINSNTSYASISEQEFTDWRTQGLDEKPNEWTVSDMIAENEKTNEKIPINDFRDTNRYKDYPKVLASNGTEFNDSLECDFNLDELPEELKKKFEELQQKSKKGYLTEKGFKNFRRRLIQLYVNQICNYEKTVKAFDITVSAFKWEREKTFADIEQSIARAQVKANLIGSDHQMIGRHLMDSYADSLRHVNHLYNQVFGIEMRKVPAHMAHFIDIGVMTRLQTAFPHHFDATSSHRIRSSDDMQFAFAYNYFLMSESQSVNISQVFDRFDTDGSGYVIDTLSVTATDIKS